MPTLYRRARLPRQESEPMVYPEELRKHWPSCTGPCQQGRRLCPCPSACQTISDEPDPPREPMTTADRIALVLCGLGIVAAVASVVASKFF